MTNVQTAPTFKSTSTLALPISCIALVLTVITLFSVVSPMLGKRHLAGLGLDINNTFDNHVVSLRLNQNREPVLTVYGKGTAALTITIPPPDQSHAFRLVTGADGTLLLREVTVSDK